MDKQDYTASETNAIQKDLEDQLRLFGASVVDGVVNGFEGRGEEINARAKDVGDAFANAAEYGLNQVSKKRWSFRAEKKPSYPLEKSASARGGTGVVQLVFGSIFGLSVLFSAVITTIVGLVASGVVGTGVMAAAVIQYVIAAPFTWMFFCGLDNQKIAKRMKRYVTELGDEVAISLDLLAEATGYSMASVKKDIKKIMKNDWCPLWFDENREMLYLSVEAYRAAKEQLYAQQPSKETAVPTANSDMTQARPLLQSVSDFVNVLGKQADIMEDADAVAELARMQETCRDIYDWMKLHPESEPKMRRFTSYYMPTTLKLLHSYNDVRDQQGENAQTIRRDIARFLHTLNTAFDNLHDSLLSSVSLDVSAEIAALQGMLAQDGLSKNDDFGAAVRLQ